MRKAIESGALLLGALINAAFFAWPSTSAQLHCRPTDDQRFATFRMIGTLHIPTREPVMQTKWVCDQGVWVWR